MKFTKFLAFFIFLFIFALFGAAFSQEVRAATDYNLHGYNGTDWIAIKVDANGLLEMSANVSSVSWNNIFDMPSVFSDNIDNLALDIWQQ